MREGRRGTEGLSDPGDTVGSMGSSDELERLVTLDRDQIEQVCADATHLPELSLIHI